MYNFYMAMKKFKEHFLNTQKNVQKTISLYLVSKVFMNNKKGIKANLLSLLCIRGQNHLFPHVVYM